MLKKKNMQTVIRVAISLALASAFMGCLKSDPGADSINASNNGLNGGAGLDGTHGGARVLLPEIDPAALAKQSADSMGRDTLPRAWFELTISGEKMSDMVFQFPLGKKGGYAFEIKSIPAGRDRSFHGRLLTRDSKVTHEGTTVADIRAGKYSDIHLYLAKALGAANVCVVIEGLKPPPCAVDTVPPPPPPEPKPISHCWYVSSDSITGRLHLLDVPQSGYTGMLVTTMGAKLPVTLWYASGDSLYVHMLSANKNKKWLYSGPVQAGGAMWIGTGFSSPTYAYVPFTGKPIACAEDSLFIPPADTVVVPPKDTLAAGAIPKLSSSLGEVTRCFELRLDFVDKCQISAYAKMSFKAGQITAGYFILGDQSKRFYSQVLGNYDDGRISMQTVSPATATLSADSLMYTGMISVDRTMAKGDFIRLPSERKGLWTMKAVVCGSWTPTNSDATCPAPVIAPK